MEPSGLNQFLLTGFWGLRILREMISPAIYSHTEEDEEKDSSNNTVPLPYEPERSCAFSAPGRAEDELGDIDNPLKSSKQQPLLDACRKIARLLPPSVGGLISSCTRPMSSGQ